MFIDYFIQDFTELAMLDCIQEVGLNSSRSPICAKTGTHQNAAVNNAPPVTASEAGKEGVSLQKIKNPNPFYHNFMCVLCTLRVHGQFAAAEGETQASCLICG